MVVIKCPMCGKNLSEHAVQCAHCGYKLKNDQQFRKEGGATLTGTEDICPDHSSTMEKQPATCAEKKKHIFRYVAIVVVFAILGFVGYEVHEYNQLKSYYQLVDEINDVRNTSVAAVNHCSSLLLDVWYNAIWNESNPETDQYTCSEGVFVDDFNDALDNLYSDDAFGKELKLIDETQLELRKLKRQLTKVPKEYEEYNEYLMELIDNWVKLSTAIQHPSGSYNDLNEEFSEMFQKDREILQELEICDN